jgi:hypothetical protein
MAKLSNKIKPQPKRNPRPLRLLERRNATNAKSVARTDAISPAKNAKLPTISPASGPRNGSGAKPQRQSAVMKSPSKATREQITASAFMLPDELSQARRTAGSGINTRRNPASPAPKCWPCRESNICLLFRATKPLADFLNERIRRDGYKIGSCCEL